MIGVSRCDHGLFLLPSDGVQVLIILLVFIVHVYFINAFILLIFNKLTNDTHANAYKINEESKRGGRKEGRGGGKVERRKQIKKTERTQNVHWYKLASPRKMPYCIWKSHLCSLPPSSFIH